MTVSNDENNILLSLPVYNEREYVEDILYAVRPHCENILVVDDGSTDGTTRLLEKFTFIHLITHQDNQGYGKSLIDIFKYAKDHQYQWIITMDCDYQHQPSYLPVFQESIKKNKADIVSGSRYLIDCSNITCVPKERLAINRHITGLLNRTLNLHLTDAFCGFKAYRTECLKRLCLREPGYGMPLELWILAAKQRLRIQEVSVPLIYHDPKRNFAGKLENPEIRLNYYLDIIERNLLSHGCKNTKPIYCS